MYTFIYQTLTILSSTMMVENTKGLGVTTDYLKLWFLAKMTNAFLLQENSIA